jgi:hypothetical protein
VADCGLVGFRPLPNQTEPQRTTHFNGRVRLTKRTSEVVTTAPYSPAGHIIEAADIYRLYFHGPAYQVLERAWWDGKQIVGLMARNLPDNHYPSELPTLMGPRLIELCFQTAGIWEMGVQSRMGLPQHIDRVSLLRSPDLAEGRLYGVVTPNQAQGSFDAEVVDAAGNRYVQLKGYRTVAVPNSIIGEPLKALQMAMSLEAVAA